MKYLRELKPLTSSGTRTTLNKTSRNKVLKKIKPVRRIINNPFSTSLGF